MECVYRVNEFAHGLITKSYFEREGNRPIFDGSVAHIGYNVTELSSGYSLEYEVLTESGEQVAFRRWETDVKLKEKAEIEALEGAIYAVDRCASAECMVDGKPARDIVRRLVLACEKITDEESRKEENQ
ncbi:hypothetical protein ACFQWC_14240 [Rossellomorea sp. GCM10028870]|uniref:hypothetical protein n=1 Tax=Rossellomorea sp. GCM10028870 TaxID=3273426 RepID=UPI00361986A3